MAIASGIEGTCAWTINNNGKLIIGAGTIDRTSGGGTDEWSWKSYRSQITSVYVGPVTFAANASMQNMFHDMPNCTEIIFSSQMDASTVTNMSYCFENCTSLKVAPSIPPSVTNMISCFYNCDSLKVAPPIPNSVSTALWCFSDCASLITMPSLPASLTQLVGMFQSSPSVKGTLHVYNAPSTTGANNIFLYTTQNPIYIVPHSAAAKTAWTTIASSYSNVTVLDEPAIDTYHNTTSNTDTITFGGYEESTINKMTSYLDVKAEKDVYMDCFDFEYYLQELNWESLDDDLEDELTTPFYFENIDKTRSISVGFKEEITGSGGTITPDAFTLWTRPVFQYSYDNSTWSNYTLGTEIILSKSTNPRVYFRGDNLTPWYVNETVNGAYRHIYLNAWTTNNPNVNTDTQPEVKCGGNIMSLRYKNFTDKTTLPCTNTFNHLFFSNCPNLIKAPQLPATTLTDSCYMDMFCFCYKLKYPPKLPATTLAPSCYAYMFSSCQGLVIPPILPATTLTDSCYYAMFQGTTSLRFLPQLSTTILGSGCYGRMFNSISASTTYSATTPYPYKITTVQGDSSNATEMFANNFRPPINTIFYVSLPTRPY